jgi:hypothetical protein
LLSSLLLFKTTEEEFGRECDRDSIIISWKKRRYSKYVWVFEKMMIL